MRWFAAGFAGFVLILSTFGCAAAPAGTATPLPAPMLHVTAAPATPTSQRPVPATWAAPTRAAASQGSVAELAREVYGGRLVERVSIPSLNIHTPVIPVGWQTSDPAGEEAAWESPDASVGWAVSSTLPDETGNVVLYGHNNLHSNVFMHLSEVQVGDSVSLDTGQGTYGYRVTGVDILAVTDREEDMAAYQRVFEPTETARLTIISCWPPTSNTHRVIVTAVPLD